MRKFITIAKVKYKVVPALYDFRQYAEDNRRHPCVGCHFGGDHCRTMMRSRTLKCVEGDEDDETGEDRKDYILIANTPEALAEYVAKRLT